MAPLHPFTPPPPETPGRRVPARIRSAPPDEILGNASSAEIILAKLRGMIAGGRQDTDTILSTIAVAAHALTGANGAAIAMPRDGEVVCVGRSGDIAPELGDRLNVNSGISGECLRTGRIMRCDDAARDFHVDPEVCRQLNLQSIAVVPLRGRQGRVGVLETFSSQSYGFTEEHMDLLGRLAGVAEAAWAQGPERQESATEVLPSPKPAAEPVNGSQPAEKTTVAKPSVTLTNLSGMPARGFSAGLQAERRWRYQTIAGLATVLTVLLALLSWKAWYRASLPVNSSRPASSLQGQEATPETAETAAGAGLAWQPGAEAPLRSLRASAAKSFAVRPLGTVIRRPTRVPRVHDRGESAPPSDSIPGANMPASEGKSAELESLLLAPPALPKLGTPPSQGVSGGVLVRKVLPTYPSLARASQVQGTVVLEGTVNEQGLIENLRVVSGPSLLAEAAMDAVRKWRYTPFMLGGKPVRKQTVINISFISPRQPF